MIKTKTKTIEGNEYSCTQMTTTKSVRTLKRLVKLMGEPIVIFMATGSGDDNDTSTVDAASMFMLRMDDEDLVELIKTMLEGVTCGTEEVVGDFDVRFAGELNLMFKVVTFVVEVNWQDFIDAAKSFVQEIISRMAAKAAAAMKAEKETESEETEAA